MRNLIYPLALSLLFLTTACNSTGGLISSYVPIEIPAAPKPVDRISEDRKREPSLPENIPEAGTYGASDIRAEKLGIYALDLRKAFRALVIAVNVRETAQDAIIERQTKEREAALKRFEDLQSGE